MLQRKTHPSLTFPCQQLTGLISSSVVWNEVLQDVFSSDVQGVDCVLETVDRVYTYTIVDGVAKFVGEGDLHEKALDEHRRTITLTPSKYFSTMSANYTLSIYPTGAFYTVYITDNATLVTVGAVCIIVFVSALFFLYDFCVRRDISAKTDLLEAKRAFVRFVSHEVRTPLNSVCMGLVLMQQELAKSAGCKSIDELDKKESREVSNPEATSDDGFSLPCYRLSKEIQKNALRSVSVLNDLLNYDKIEMGNLKLELKVIRLQELVESTVQEFAVPASQKKIAMTVDFSEADEALKTAKSTTSSGGPGSSHACQTVGDDIRLQQVMRNLISNALKFTPENGKISVCATWVNPVDSREGQALCKFVLNSGVEMSVPQYGWMKVSVIDSGAGMTGDQLSKVFGAGVQFNANELQGGNGTGLGLHIAKGIMEQHNGTLEVSSLGLGHGTTFTLSIPIHDVPTDSHNVVGVGCSEIENDEETQTDCEPHPLKLLIVDDAAMNRKLLARLLRTNGHECDEAENGEVAVRLVREAMDSGQPYHSVLLDNEMPVMNGPIAAYQMRQLGSDAVIVGVTGNLLPEDVAIFERKGANSVLPKPFKMSDLESLWMEQGAYKVGSSLNGKGC